MVHIGVSCLDLKCIRPFKPYAYYPYMYGSVYISSTFVLCTLPQAMEDIPLGEGDEM